jgi:hypothetical protein
MSTPAQMFDHELNGLKGWPNPYAVDKHANLKEGDTVIAGQVMCLDANADFNVGLTENAMAIFALQNSDDFDVISDDGGLVGGGQDIPRMSGLVAVGAFELESTEFNSSSTYNPNTPLTSPAPGAANAGRLDVGVVYTDTICGVTSDGVVSNERAISVLRFWPVWLPVIPA